MEFRYYEAGGYGIGEEISREFPQGGTFAVLSLQGLSATPTIYDAEFKGITKALSGKSFTLELLDLEPLGESLEGILNRLEAGQKTPELWELVAKIPHVDGWISLQGQPVATEPEQLEIPVVFVNPTGHASTWQENTRLEFKTKRMVPGPEMTSKSTSEAELFALHYQVVRKP